MSTASVTPAGIEGLLWAAEQAWPLVQRFDGPEATWPEHEFIAIGLNPLDPEVRAARVPAGQAPSSTLQVGDITCMIRAWDGDRIPANTRGRAYGLLDGLVAQLADDPTLNGRVSHCEVIDETYQPSQRRRGLSVDLLFTVQCKRF